MEKFSAMTGIVAPLMRANVDTDQIIPKQFLKSIKRVGFGQNLFDEWRYLDEGQPGQDCSNRPLNPEFVLNQPVYQGASILLAGPNFGCGSSREHAPWALKEFGFRVIIAASFADIFFNNCFKNGILALTLAEAELALIEKAVTALPGLTLDVDLAQQTLHAKSAAQSESDLAEVKALHQALPITFDVDPFRKHCLLEGLDDIGLTLAQSDQIKAFEVQRRQQAPWVFNPL